MNAVVVCKYPDSNQVAGKQSGKTAERSRARIRDSKEIGAVLSARCIAPPPEQFPKKNAIESILLFPLTFTILPQKFRAKAITLSLGTDARSH
jgi:hypothetical protein